MLEENQLSDAYNPLNLNSPFQVHEETKFESGGAGDEWWFKKLSNDG